jgi:hypothetical protein
MRHAEATCTVTHRHRKVGRFFFPRVALVFALRTSQVVRQFVSNWYGNFLNFLSNSSIIAERRLTISIAYPLPSWGIRSGDRLPELTTYFLELISLLDLVRPCWGIWDLVRSILVHYRPLTTHSGQYKPLYNITNSNHHEGRTRAGQGKKRKTR